MTMPIEPKYILCRSQDEDRIKHRVKSLFDWTEVEIHILEEMHPSWYFMIAYSDELLQEMLRRKDFLREKEEVEKESWKYILENTDYLECN